MRASTLLLAASAAAVCLASTLSPPVIPLIVRNPYLSAWLGHARDNPWEHWPMFWTGESLGLSVLAAVPETKAVYPLLGRPHDGLSKSGDSFEVKYASYLGTDFDASTTNLTYEIFGSSKKPVTVVLSFLSPITPTSTFRQSIPAAYLTVEVSGDFDIDVYLDINGQWSSFGRDNRIEWEFNQSNDYKAFTVRRTIEQLYTEVADQAEWGSLHVTGPSDIQHEVGTSALLRTTFARTGTLRNVIDSNFRNVMEDEPVFAFSKSFKLNTTSTANSKNDGRDSVLFTIAHIQDPVLQYASEHGLKHMRPLWASYEENAEALLEWHYNDFNTAAGLASNYSKQLEKDALQSGSEDYKDILALSARQVIGASSFSGTPKNPLIFFKEISSDGNINTVDVIFPAFPFFLYTNPRWLAYLLEPVFEVQLSGQYPNHYCMHDIGSSFPNATGHPDGKDEYMPVEESGNMLIMSLALVNAFKYQYKVPSIWSAVGEPGGESLGGYISLYVDSNRMDDTVGGPIDSKGHRQGREWIKKSYWILKQWTGYLVREALIPSNQLSTDDFAGWLANQTNLALKGIIGIRAMSDIAATIGENDDAIHYRNISETYVKRWYDEFAMSRDGTHAKLAYTWYGSWTMLYNLFADSLLCFRTPSQSSQSFGEQVGQSPLTDDSRAFVPSSVYRAQSDWYYNVRQRYGIPLDSRHQYTKSDWEFFTIAVASKKVREEVIDSIALWVNETDTDRPLTDIYETETGSYPGIYFKARPVVGGHFAYLALERACGGEAVKELTFLNEEEHEKENGLKDEKQRVLAGRGL